MTAPEPAPVPPKTPRDRMEARLRKIIRGPDTERAVWLILADADEYAAWMAEAVARPDDRWEPR